MKRSNRRSVTTHALAVTATLALLAACGGGDDDDAATTSEPTSEAASSASTGTSGGSTGTTGAAAGGELVWARNSQIDGWEGDACVGPSTQTNPVVYDTLVRMSVPDGQSIVGGLAETFSYDEATFTYTFDLRPDAGFSNGQPVTAEDVKFSVDEWVAGPISGAYYQSVASAAVVDADTVSVTMKQADTFFPALLTWCTSAIYPKDFAGIAKDDFFQQPIGAGPFAVAEWNDPAGPNEEIVLTRNEYYWGADEGLPKLDRLVIRTISDPNQRALAFDAGEVQILEDVDTATKRQIDENLLIDAPRQQMYGFVINTERVTDVKIRQAISKAIDREAIVEVLDRDAEVAPGVLPINVPDAVPPTEPNEFDLEEAKALIAETSAADGITLQYAYNAANADETTIAQNLQSQLAEIGVDLELMATDAPTLSSMRSSGDFDLAPEGTASISPTIFDPIGLMLAVNYPHARANLTVINEQFLIGTASTDPAVRQAAVLAIQDDAMAQAAQIGLVNVASTYGVQDGVEGFVLLPYVQWYTDVVGLAS